SRFFRAIIISSEVGADKPDSFIFKRALDLAGVDATQALHVGDDPVHDWQGAAAAGLQVFELKRPQVTLRELVVACAAW
ncbi:MAG: HAD-IA family hydrolase, partial [Chthoniobacterales bacterium]|nr:HAD-IA family hydrolase [Chthoniobacterales bacterium]